MVKVLIVDDEDDLRESLQEFFEGEGYEVASACNGAEALVRLTEGALPGVVILDLVMPIRDGNYVHAAMQADPRLASIPVIVSTSDPSRAPSGVFVLKKPIDLGTLRRAVEERCPGGDRRPAVRAIPERESGPPRTSSGGKRVLVVDDDVDTAEMTVEVLIASGHDARHALTGADALVVATEFRPHVVLLDLGLPGLDGFAVAAELRRAEPPDGGSQALRIVAVSGRALPEDRAKTRAAGFDGHLAKPVPLAALVRAVEG